MPNSTLERVRDSTIRQAAIAAQDAGWTLKWSKSGHLKFFDATGQLVTIAAGTPSDWRGPKNLIATLRQAGLHVRSEKAGPSTQRTEVIVDEYREWAKEQRALSDAQETDTAERETASVIEPVPSHDTRRPGEVVLSFLREHPGERFDAPTIAKHIGYNDPKRVRNALASLVRAGKPGFAQVSRGRYVFEPKTAEVRISTVAPAPPKPPSPPKPVDRPLPVRTTSERLADVEAKARANGQAELPTMFEAVTTDRQGRLVLRDEYGDIWIAAPVKVDF